MTPEQTEACAKRAYEIMAANANEPTTWEASKNKTFWIDLVTTLYRVGGKTTNLQEHCAAQAVAEFREAHPQVAEDVTERPLVIPPIAAAAPAPAAAPAAPPASDKTGEGEKSKGDAKGDPKDKPKGGEK